MIRKLIKNSLKFFGWTLIRNSHFENMKSDYTRTQIRSNLLAKLETVSGLVPESKLTELMEVLHHSKSQLGQDLWVFGNSSGAGSFLEIGAFDGFSLSNTYMLERLGWTGTLVEPVPYDSLKNRNSRVLNVYVGKTKGLVDFALTVQKEYSTRLDLLNFDGLGQVRNSYDIIPIESIDLKSLLKQAEAPQTINYVSIDTEGNELEILEQWDFTSHKVLFWSIETNGRADRLKIDDIMKRNSYCYIDNKSGFDAWYTIHGTKSCLHYHRAS